VGRFLQEELHAHTVGELVTYKVKEQKKVLLPELAHNRAKRRLFQEGQPIELLQELGIMSASGAVSREKYDKFKQINRFLELVQDLLPELPETLSIVDFGCGKAYLTFALYEMLKSAKIIGLEARRDLVEKGKALARRLKFNNLHFIETKIEDYQINEPVDLVLALHACDTATDAALAKAIELDAKAILVAPCCQHEVASQLKKEALPVVLKHGLLKERFAALLTDALRAEILEACGYQVTMCEFIDPEHTPKNLLIRAIKKKTQAKADFSAYKEAAKRFGVTLSLAKLLKIDT
jgi:SAM-dependent methyltransferase